MYTYAIRHRMCYFHQEHAKRRFVPTHDSYKGKCYHSASYSTKVSLINSYEEKPSNNRVNKSSGKTYNRQTKCLLLLYMTLMALHAFLVIAIVLLLVL